MNQLHKIKIADDTHNSTLLMNIHIQNENTSKDGKSHQIHNYINKEWQGAEDLEFGAERAFYFIEIFVSSF